MNPAKVARNPRNLGHSAPATKKPAGPCLAIVGSRGFHQLDRVRQLVRSLSLDTVIVSGGARGVDQCAAEAARARGMQVIEYIPAWERLGRRAGFVRNKLIVLRCHRMVAFWDGLSSGTAHSISLAQQLGRPVVVVGPDGLFDLDLLTLPVRRDAPAEIVPAGAAIASGRNVR